MMHLIFLSILDVIVCVKAVNKRCVKTGFFRESNTDAEKSFKTGKMSKSQKWNDQPTPFVSVRTCFIFNNMFGSFKKVQNNN